MAEFLTEKGLPTLDVSTFDTLEGLLEACSGHYFTSGLSSLKAIPDSSVDFIWSNAVLEHVRKREFAPMMCELRRIIAENGVCSHTIDLRDHLGYALNNLRFSHALWESEFMVRSGIYTNRIRYSEMLNIFKQAGFDAQVVNKQSWDTLPTPVNKFNKEFRRLPEEELKIWEFDVVLNPSAPL
jgi:SAM-dependent methyltransferase